MLKDPDAWWVVGLRDLLGNALFDLRGLLHRIAAVVMVADSLYHVYYVAFTTRGRRFISDIFFRKSDFREMVQMVRFNLGMTPRRPEFDRFNYIEKSEYWALIWGTIVMTITGVVLWFENHFMGQYSKLFVDINETIHYYEAWLAFLAIVVWHFYYVIFNPDVYPMNFTWITGKMTEQEMAHEHPRELERIKEESSAEESSA
jgi:cytochrome b subunit of formate dehydrogenase